MKINITKLEQVLFILLLVLALFQEEVYSIIRSSVVFIPLYIVLGLMIALYLVDIGMFFKRKGKFSCFINDRRSVFLWSIFVLYILFSIFWSSFNVYNISQRLLIIFESIGTMILANVYIDGKFYKKVMIFLVTVLGIDLLLTFQQNIIWGLYEDFCNGIFGYIGYGSGAVGMFCIGLSIIAIVNYDAKVWGLLTSLVVILFSSVICALAEVKIYYILFILVLSLFFVLDGMSVKLFFRNIAIILGVSILFYIAYIILSIIFPYNLNAMFSIDAYLAYDSRSTYAGRTNTIPFILSTLFQNAPIRSLFGMGLGTSSTEYIYELGKTFSDLGFIGIVLLGIPLIEPLITWILSSTGRTSQLFLKAIFSIALIIGIIVWNIPFVRSVNIFIFLLLGISTKINYKAKKEENLDW